MIENVKSFCFRVTQENIHEFWYSKCYAHKNLKYMLYGIIRDGRNWRVEVFVRFVRDMLVSTVQKLFGADSVVTAFSTRRNCMENNGRDYIISNDDLVTSYTEIVNGDNFRVPYCKNKNCKCKEYILEATAVEPDEPDEPKDSDGHKIMSLSVINAKYDVIPFHIWKARAEIGEYLIAQQSFVDPEYLREVTGIEEVTDKQLLITNE